MIRAITDAAAVRFGSLAACAALTLALAPEQPAGAADRLLCPEQPSSLLRFDLPANARTAFPVTIGSNGRDGACAPDGHVYFGSCCGSRTIERWAQDGTDAASVGLPAGVSPTGLAFDAAGDLWIWGDGNGGPDGGLFRLAGGDPAGTPTLILRPALPIQAEAAEIVAGGPHAGALLLGELSPARVYLSEPPGAPLVEILGSAQLAPPSALISLVTNEAGEIFAGWVNSKGGRIDRFSPDGVFLENLAFGLGVIFQLALDSDGNVFALEDRARIYKIDAARARTVFYDSGGNGLLGMAMCRAPFTASAGGPYLAECAGARTCLDLAASPQPLGATYSWTSDCPGADFGGTESSPTPVLCVDSGAAACPTRCTATLAATLGSASSTASAAVDVADTTPPVVTAVLAPAPPRPPASARSACSAPSRGTFRIACGGTDACDAAVAVDARLVITSHDVARRGGPCVPRVEEIVVACDEVIDVELVAPPCPVRPPRRPRPAVSVTSSGRKVITGESVVLEVSARDACGNEASARYDVTSPPPPPCDDPLPDGSCCPPLAPPAAPRCPVPACGPASRIRFAVGARATPAASSTYGSSSAEPLAPDAR